MHLVLAWFADRPLPVEAVNRARARLDREVARVVPDTYARLDVGGDDWGLSVHHPAGTGFRWPVVAGADDVTAVSLGLPVGIDADDPVDLARRLLGGEDVQARVVPPFGAIALASPADPRRVVVQQDWLGMCRLFTARADGVTALCSRAGTLAAFLSGRVEPDLDGWAAYAVCGHFAGDLAPVRGTRLLSPGERITGHRRAGGGWSLTAMPAYAVADVIRTGIQARGAGVGAALDLAADGLTRAVADVHDLCDGEIQLGLSGGKDSRLIAAAFVAAGRLPLLLTNEDRAAEGQTARALVRILREGRGLRPNHRVYRAGRPAAVLRDGLRERVTRMQSRYDFQFPATFTVRAAPQAGLPAVPRAASITGAGGELAVGYWYPPAEAGDDADRALGLETALRHLTGAVPRGTALEQVLTGQRERVAGVVADGAALGLTGLELVDYAYLMERARRWYTSAYHLGMVTPFLTPGVVAASFALSPAQKRARLLHTGLLERFLPDWAGVPFVSAGTSGPSRATRIWEGDGLRVVCDLLDTAGGDLARLLRPEAVQRSARRCARGAGNADDQRLLQQFAWLAIGSESLQPDAVRPSTSATYARVTTPTGPRSAAGARRSARRLRFVSPARLGRRLWRFVRARVNR